MSNGEVRLIPGRPVQWSQEEGARVEELIGRVMVSRVAGYRIASEFVRIAPGMTDEQLKKLIDDTADFFMAKGLEDLAKVLKNPPPRMKE